MRWITQMRKIALIQCGLFLFGMVGLQRINTSRNTSAYVYKNRLTHTGYFTENQRAFSGLR